MASAKMAFAVASLELCWDFTHRDKLKELELLTSCSNINLFFSCLCKKKNPKSILIRHLITDMEMFALTICRAYSIFSSYTEN